MVRLCLLHDGGDRVQISQSRWPNRWRWTRQRSRSRRQGERVATITITLDELQRARPTRVLSQQHRRSSSFNEGKKRKIGDTYFSAAEQEVEAMRKVEDPIAFVILESLEALKKLSGELEKIITENPNTKKEIKEISTKFRRGMDFL